MLANLSHFAFEFSSTKKQKIVKTIGALPNNYYEPSQKYLARDTIPLKLDPSHRTVVLIKGTGSVFSSLS
jgi:hypothetical protein